VGLALDVARAEGQAIELRRADAGSALEACGIAGLPGLVIHADYYIVWSHAMLLLETQAHAIQSRRNNQESISRTKNPPKSLIDGQGPGRVGGFSKTVD
jgi:hypothetical protein